MQGTEACVSARLGGAAACCPGMLLSARMRGLQVLTQATTKSRNPQGTAAAACRAAAAAAGARISMTAAPSCRLHMPDRRVVSKQHIGANG